MADPVVVSAFSTPLRFEDDNGLPLTLLSPLVYFSALLKRELTVPAGFVTDLASIPRALWAILPPIGKYDRAAVLHDFLYRFGGVTRAEADGVLKEAMEVKGVSRLVCWAIYTGIRSGGWVVWNKYRSSDPAVRSSI